MVIRVFILCLLSISLSGQFSSALPGVIEGAGGSEPDTTDIYDIAGKVDFMFTPDSALNSGGDKVSDGDEIYGWDGIKGKYDLTDRVTRPTQTKHFDTIPKYCNNSLELLPYMDYVNATDFQWFDNTIAAGDTAPTEYYYVMRYQQSALNEKFFNGAFTIEDNSNSYYSTRFNGTADGPGGEVDWQSSGGTGIFGEWQLVGLHQIFKRSGYSIFEIDTGGGFVAYGDSVFVDDLAGVKFSNMQLGTPTRGNSQHMFLMAGTTGRLLSESDRTYIEDVLHDEFDFGSVTITPHAYAASWSFESTENIFTLTWSDTCKTSRTIDSVQIRVCFEDESYAPGNWVDGLELQIDTTDTYANLNGTYSFDRDDYPDLSAGTQSEYIKGYIRLYDSVTGWSDWTESLFIVNNTA